MFESGDHTIFAPDFATSEYCARVKAAVWIITASGRARSSDFDVPFAAREVVDALADVDHEGVHLLRGDVGFDRLGERRLARDAAVETRVSAARRTSFPIDGKGAGCAA
jgi:hypothetical protein